MMIVDATQTDLLGMTAIVYEGTGDLGVIRTREMELPLAGPGELVIKVVAAGLNRADIAQRMGHYPPPPDASEIPGLEVSGTVVGRGPGVSSSQWPDGTEVCALLAGGGYAQYVNVPEGQVMKVPEGYDLVQAAGLPEVAATVVSNLDLTVPVQESDWVMVHGGSGGIGTFALQYLKSLGARTIATCSTPEKERWARDHGADFTINYTTEDFSERVRDITEGHGCDIILDVVGAKYLKRNVESLADGGRLLIIGLIGGARGEVDLGSLLSKRAGVIATSLRSRPLAAKARVIALVRDKVWPLVLEGTIDVPIDRTFPLEQAREAQEYFDSGQHTGKVLLQVADAPGA